MSKSNLSAGAPSFVPQHIKDQEAEKFIKELHQKEQQDLEKDIRDNGIDKIWSEINEASAIKLAGIKSHQKQ